jgi:peptidyl-prolyl cis-trans isomerase B (cyclophilin B)
VLGSSALLARLRDDPHPRVRAEVLEQELSLLLAHSGAELGELEKRLEQALASAVPLIRRTALDFLIATPLLAPVELETATGEQGVRFARVRLRAVRALEARARQVPADGEQVDEALRRLAADRLHVVRQEAARALEARGAEAPAPGPVETGRSVGVYREILARTANPVVVRLVTELGGVVVSLSCRDAPLSCVSFRQLAAQGFYDGSPFLAVVPWGVALAGRDPGGGPGYFLRDEVSPDSFDRAGMLALVGEVPDGNAGELVFTLSPQPRLDGEATLLGGVTEGLDVLLQLVRGDRIVGLREVLP